MKSDEGGCVDRLHTHSPWRGRKRFIALLSFFCGLLVQFAIAGQAVAAVAPKEDLKQGIDAIVAVLTDEKLAEHGRQDERRERIFAEVKIRFDFRRMAELTMAGDWEKRDSKEQDRFTDFFSRLILERYIGRIESYDNESVLYKKELVKGDKARVYTVIIQNDKEIAITYSLERQGENWMIYDVILEGVSLVRNYRSEFGVILKREGFDSLLARIEEKIKQMQK